ncbi:MAG TPA: hypothetical protein VHM30_14855 [Gemmatimonadaceae bacterium]|nr:hypothetical protein [Gemmatimonadaceae bacterium]
MLAILIEGTLFVAGLAALGALLSYLVFKHTPVGVRLRQAENRKRIERAAELRCPIHGDHAPEDMVRLPSGMLICPQCFQEIVDDKPDEPIR